MINRKFVWLVLSLIIFSLQANAQEKITYSFVLTNTGKKAYQNLVDTNLFALGGIGYSGSTSDGEKSLDILLQEREGKKALQELAKTVSSEGGLYALIGLKMLKCDCFVEAVNDYKKLPEPPERKGYIGKTAAGAVTRMSGCFISWQKRLEVAEEIVKGDFDEEIEWKIRLKEQKENQVLEQMRKNQ